MTVEDVVTFASFLRYFRIGQDAAGVATHSLGRTLLMKARWHEREHAWFRYWQSLSSGALLRVSVAVFVTFSTFSFVSDLAVPRPSPYWWVLVWASQWGTISTLYFLTATRWPKLLPAAVVVHLATMFVLFKLLPLYSTELPINTPLISLHQRQVLDGIIAMIVIVLGYG